MSYDFLNSLVASLSRRHRHRAGAFNVPVLSLSAGAMGWAGWAHANGDKAAYEVMLLPEHYELQDNGVVVFRLETGESLSLTADQYLIMQDGLLLITDEIAQASISTLPVMGSLRAQLMAQPVPVRSPDGSVIEVTSAEPLLTGFEAQQVRYEALNPKTYELAQAVLGSEADQATIGSQIGTLLLGGTGLLAVLNSLLSDGTEEATADADEESSSSGSSSSVSGRALKGPLANAFVFADENGNGVFDDGEPNTLTDSDGDYTLTGQSSSASIIVQTNEQTIDTASGSILAGLTLSAPAGASVVSPLTTLLEETGLTTAELQTVLGLASDVDPLSYDPYDTGVDADTALAVEKLNVQLVTTLTAFASAAQGAGASEEDAFAAALSSLSTVIQDQDTAGTQLDLTDATDLSAIETAFVSSASSLSGLDTASLNGVVGDVTTAVNNVNDAIDALANTDLTDPENENAFGLIGVLQDQVEEAAEGGDSITLTDPDEVDTAASNAAPTDIVLSEDTIADGATDYTIGSLSATDDATVDPNFIYSIAEIDDTDFASFTINQATRELSLTSEPDYDTQSSYSVVIVAEDEGGKKYSETFSINVTSSYFGPFWTNDEVADSADVSITGTTADEYIGYSSTSTPDPLSNLGKGSGNTATFDMSLGGDNAFLAATSAAASGGSLLYTGGSGDDSLTFSDVDLAAHDGNATFDMSRGGTNTFAAGDDAAAIDGFGVLHRWRR